MPPLPPGARWRVLRDAGLTLIDPWAAEPPPALARAPAVPPPRRAAGGPEVGAAADDADHLRALLAAAGVPASYADALLAAARDERVPLLAQLARAGAAGGAPALRRPELERVARRAALPLGHRLRLLNAATRAGA